MTLRKKEMEELISKEKTLADMFLMNPIMRSLQTQKSYIHHP